MREAPGRREETILTVPTGAARIKRQQSYNGFAAGLSGAIVHDYASIHYLVPALLPDDPLLRAALNSSDISLVACLCAEWCDTCREYRTKFDALAERLDKHVFVWIDIEDYPDLTDDEDIENFPTLLIQTTRGIAFYGTMLPHIGHLEKFLDTLEDGASTGEMPGPDVLGMLRQMD